MKGTVKFWNRSMRYGYLRVEGQHAGVRVSYRDVAQPFMRDLKAGDEVEFDLAKNGFEAENAKLITPALQNSNTPSS